ncbi:MAG: UDP-glucose 4-epimerase GalE [Planctomycetota bacterium]|nr:UDP-glucose 4-epimerase GalE [Planctomycetota bacterium]
MSSAVLVTGGAGYVGSACAQALAAAGRTPVVLDDLSTGHREFVRWGPLIVGDIADADLVTQTLREHGIGAVMHFAAKSLIGESVKEPALYDSWNRGKTTALVEAARGAGVGAFVFSSTAAVYGTPEHTPIPESAACAPINPYGSSKVACEDALAASGLPYAALRYFNAAGGLPSEGVGEWREHETHIIPLAIRAARTSKPLTILGTDYPTPDGTCVRDYIHVADLASAHLLALEHLEGGGASGAWNLGTEHGSSVREVVEAVGAAFGAPVPTVEGARRPGDPATLVADAARARADFGWRPTRSSMAQIAADAVACDRLFHGRGPA